MGCVRASALLVAGLLAFVAPASARRPPKCSTDFQTCYTDGCANVDDCFSGVDDDFDTCKSNIPAVAGKCTLSSDRLHDCEAQRGTRRLQCVDSLRRKIQQDCRAANTPCRMSRRVARLACDIGPLRTAAVVPEQAGDDPGNCQMKCIRSVAADCYAKCTDACNDNDPAALPFCQLGCRNALCTELENRCTSDGVDAADYHTCCDVFGSCADAVDCTVTTTSSTSTTTTSTSTSTTTTTLI